MKDTQQVENTEKQIIEKKKSKLKLIVVILSCIMIAAVGAGCIFCQFLYTSNVNLANQIEEAKREWEGCTVSHNKVKIDLAATAAELEKSKSRLIGIKNQDDLMKRDIGMYIQYRYRKIPRTVAETIAKVVVEQSNAQEVSAELVVGIIEIESRFNPSVVGPKTKYGHARGLMQLMPEWAPKFKLANKFDFHDIETNIASGIKVLKIHVGECDGNVTKGLYKYVNGSKEYAGDVYEAMGKFVSFRSTIDDDKTTAQNDEKELAKK